jgi:regulator of chromosome condensation
VTANVVNKRKELVNHIKTLNKNFSDWFRNEYQKDPNVCMIDGVQDYIDYMKQLEDKYLRSYGEVLTFGSGDCGQLAHGIESDDDLMVKYPRIVYSLRCY